MTSIRLCTLTAIGCAFLLSLPKPSDAQIVRRFAGGGVQVNAPFVRVNVGPGGGTSVRAPFTAVDSPGRVYLGRRRRFLGQPPSAASQRRVAPRTLNTAAEPVKQPETADIDALPYPTAYELAAMDDTALVETLRQMMARLHYRLSLLNTGEGWQKYLVLSREILGSPGAGPEAAQLGAIQKVLPHYRSVQDNPEYGKIATLPSFVAAYHALQEVHRRFPNTGPEITDPNFEQASPDEPPIIEESLEILPTPTPAALPNASRGERSILKRK